ncbi:RNA pyrophosphohydrolase [Belnapia moabensis]|uniref:RNA pyrophosphohydrolase n=1 Tax=Belnapia moabensis TaxID=365533 RepID=UPI0005BE73B8|nr:RNA pyrophosphohydrolase [Belnapia moabensis]
MAATASIRKRCNRTVLVARRADLANTKGAPGGWQLLHGGMDQGEDPAVAVFREIEEEIGTRNAEIIPEHPDWLSYDLPPQLLGKALGGRYRGQRQKWFAPRFLGEDAEIRLDLDPHPEFDAWRWVPLATLPSLAVSFKAEIYAILARDFVGHGG